MALKSDRRKPDSNETEEVVERLSSCERPEGSEPSMTGRFMAYLGRHSFDHSGEFRRGSLPWEGPQEG